MKTQRNTKTTTPVITLFFLFFASLCLRVFALDLMQYPADALDPTNTNFAMALACAAIVGKNYNLTIDLIIGS